MTAPLEALYASDGVAPAVRATVSSTRLPGDMDIITDTVANWPHRGIATSGTPDDDGVIIPGTECIFEFVLSGTIIHIVDFAPGYSDIGHEENQIVIIKPTTYHNDSLINAIENFETLPPGGTTGQILSKISDADGDAAWEDAPESGNSIISKEVPSGAVNGTNKTFTTSLPYIGGSLQVWVNGLAQSFMATETTPTSGIFNLDVAPLTGDDVVASYMFAPAGTGNADTIDGYHASSTPAANSIPVLDGDAKLSITTVRQSSGHSRNLIAATRTTSSTSWSTIANAPTTTVTTNGGRLMVYFGAQGSVASGNAAIGVQVDGTDYMVCNFPGSVTSFRSGIIRTGILAAGTYTVTPRFRTDGAILTLSAFHDMSVAAWEVAA